MTYYKPNEVAHTDIWTLIIEHICEYSLSGGFFSIITGELL